MMGSHSILSEPITETVFSLCNVPNSPIMADLSDAES